MLPLCAQLGRTFKGLSYEMLKTLIKQKSFIYYHRHHWSFDIAAQNKL